MASPASGASSAADLPDYAPIPRSALGPALNDQGYYVGRVERNLYWVTHGVYQSAVTNRVTHLVYSHHHAAHGGTASLFDVDVVRIGQEETRRLLLRDNDPAGPLPEVTFADRYTLEVGGERVELAGAGAATRRTRAAGARCRTASRVDSQGGHRSPNHVQGGPL